MSIEIKKDKYFKARDSYAEFWSLACSNCNTPVILYQKDGHGKLYRCYLNRIFAPKEYASLQFTAEGTKDMPPMKCPNCDALFGKPMLHWEGRLAYVLSRGGWKKKKLKNPNDWNK